MNFDNKTEVEPLRALIHPIWVIGLFVLVINDHVLKTSGHAGWLTGKLSDFAGLLIVPVLIAAILRVRTTRGVWISGAAVGIVFAGINVSAPLAAIWDNLASTLYPFHTTVDPTDLIALVSIPLGIWLFTPWMRRNAFQSGVLRALQAAMVILGGLSSIATSPPPCEEDDSCCLECEPPNFTDSPVFQSQIGVYNRTHELHVLRVRYLVDTLDLDCEVIKDDPIAFLGSDAFGPAERWFVQSGQQIGLTPPNFGTQGECQAALIQSDSTPDIMAFWETGLPTQTFEFDVVGPKDGLSRPQTIILDGDYSDVPEEEVKEWRFRTSCGMRADWCDVNTLAPAAEIPLNARYSWSSENQEFQHPLTSRTGEIAPSEACQTPSAGEGVLWGEVEFGVEFSLTSIESKEDGCHFLEMTSNETNREWWICAPESVMEKFALDDSPTTFTVNRTERRPNGFEGGYEGLKIDTSHTSDDVASSHEILLIRGYRLPQDIDFDVSLREQCQPVEEECGQVSLPVDLSIRGQSLAPSETMVIGEGDFKKSLSLIRATFQPVVNLACETHSQRPQYRVSRSTYLEAAIISEKSE